MALWTPDNDLIPQVPNSGQSFFALGGVETSHRFSQNQLTGSSGQLWVSYFTAIANVTVTKLGMGSANNTAAGTTLARCAAFTVTGDDSITKVAQTASDNSIGASTYTHYERVLSTVGGFPSSYTFLAGIRYALGFLHVATTPCNLGGFNFSYDAQPPAASRKIGGQTDIAASYAVANLPSWYLAAWLTARP
jgi:hypothetical protein